MVAGAAGILVRWAAPDPARVGEVLEGLGLAVSPRSAGLWVELANAAIAIERLRDADRGQGRSSWGRIVGVEVNGPAEVSPRSSSAGSAARSTLLAVAWATVDLERAVGELGGAGGDGDPVGLETGSDDILGARFAIVPSDRLPGVPVVLLEPSTEGRLAASLVAAGEGLVGLYLRSEGRGAASRIARSQALVGPYGRERLVLGGPILGPHLLLVEPAQP